MAPQTIEDLLIAEAARIDALHGERRSHELVKFAIAAPAIAAIEHRLAQSLEVTEAEIELVQKRFGAVAAGFLRSVKQGAAAGALAGGRGGIAVGQAANNAVRSGVTSALQTTSRVVARGLSRTGAAVRRAGSGDGARGAAYHAGKSAEGLTAPSAMIAGVAGGAAVGAAAGAVKHVAPSVVRGSKALAGYYQRAKGSAGDLGAAVGEKVFVGSGAHRTSMQVGRSEGATRAAKQIGGNSGWSASEGRHVNNSMRAGGAQASRVARGEAASLGRKIATRAFDVAGGLTAAITGGAAAYGAYRAGKKDGRAGRDADGDGKKDESKKGGAGKPITNREGIAR